MKNQELDRIRKRIEELTPEWEDEFGIGNCGAVAGLLRELGYGKIAMIYFPDGAGYPTPHFVIAVPNSIMIDATGMVSDGRYGIDHHYAYEDIWPDDEYPEMYGPKEIAWWRERI